LAFGIFGKKDQPSQPSPAGAAPAANAAAFAPDKAEKFFGHARTVAETGNYEYAMQLYLSGLRFDPNNMTAMQAFFQTSAQFLNSPEGKKGPGKDTAKSVADATDVHRYLKGLLDWAMKPTEAELAVQALEKACTLNLQEPANWIGERALGACLREKKPEKRRIMRVCDAFVKVQQWEKAIASAEQALRLDPSDGELGKRIREMAANATMTKGGYGKTGQEGGFRENIRDVKKQQELEAADRISKTEETIEMLIERAEAELIKRPTDQPTMEALAKRLLERGKPADEERVHAMYTDMFTKFGQFRYREQAGDIRIRQKARKVRELRSMLEKSPGNEMIERMKQQEERELVELEASEFALRVENYPTEMNRKYELAKRYMYLERFDDAIALLQETQQDAKLRQGSQNQLGLAFLKIGYFEESVQVYRQALEKQDTVPELELELRYHLMLALIEQGKASKDANSLRDADKQASSIAMKQFNFRDIRAKRDEIKKLLTELA
jgi:tetratricopeptide (TPR) repeat protein